MLEHSRLENYYNSTEDIIMEAEIAIQFKKK